MATPAIDYDVVAGSPSESGSQYYSIDVWSFVASTCLSYAISFVDDNGAVVTGIFTATDVVGFTIDTTDEALLTLGTVTYTMRATITDHNNAVIETDYPLQVFTVTWQGCPESITADWAQLAAQTGSYDYDPV
jgi:DNA-binding beta-propeller fold protein YncE